MANKTELMNILTEWISLDRELTKIQQEVKNKKNRKKELNEKLIGIMKSNEIDCFDISDGKILYTKNNVKMPLTNSRKSLVSIVSLSKSVLKNSSLKFGISSILSFLFKIV